MRFAIALVLHGCAAVTVPLEVASEIERDNEAAAERKAAADANEQACTKERFHATLAPDSKPWVPSAGCREFAKRERARDEDRESHRIRGEAAALRETPGEPESCAKRRAGLERRANAITNANLRASTLASISDCPAE